MSIVIESVGKIRGQGKTIPDGEAAVDRKIITAIIQILFKQKTVEDFLSVLQNDLIPEIQRIDDLERRSDVIENVRSRMNSDSQLDIAGLKTLREAFPQVNVL
jgi:hypothetical protein